MKLDITQIKDPKDFQYKESQVYLERQQNIDAVLVLSKLLEDGVSADTDLKSKARLKISSLIDKV